MYYADARAKWLVTHDPALKKSIVALLGHDAYLPDGTYNRAFVSGQVFHNAEKLAALNRLVHPAVERDSVAWHAEQASKGAPYTLKEAALMVESGSHRLLDALIAVTAPEAVRIQRVMQRDDLEEAAVRARMDNQLPESAKVALANYVVVNDGTRLLLPQVLAIHRNILGNKP